MQEFSVLLPVYGGDSLAFFREAVRSNTVGQARRPSQLVVARDGRVPDEVEEYLVRLPGLLEPEGVAVTVVRLEECRGLAAALNEGLKACAHEFVARADADDIALPERYAVEIPVLEAGADLVGSSIQEFTQESADRGDKIERGQVRTLPAGGPELERYARMQSPLHHPSVAFRRSAVLDAGGYPERAGRFEDYLLWARLMMRGAKLRNVPDVLVLYRVDAGAYTRRGGWEMFRGELGLQRAFLKMGFVNVPQFARNVLVRAAYRLVPTGLRQRGYRAVVALRGRKRP
ncbi:glycosyltransferase [Bifidobacterium avesanii]|uniref:Glycosyltransferase n=1 Tax=Bifidobacterium avesanii TaxID=1798157 RepID=A0A7K3TET2_9BIFI|nr:glycosyltransferase [Bifidobacterium avesanii]KAB8295593.1 glycosyl transferase family 2 [Bifidobacterium avesanii]NEG77597.1 glycosyltransferase [Bifidobacterium avesanii]